MESGSVPSEKIWLVFDGERRFYAFFHEIPEIRDHPVCCPELFRRKHGLAFQIGTRGDV